MERRRTGGPDPLDLPAAGPRCAGRRGRARVRGRGRRPGALAGRPGRRVLRRHLVELVVHGAAGGGDRAHAAHLVCACRGALLGAGRRRADRGSTARLRRARSRARMAARARHAAPDPFAASADPAGGVLVRRHRRSALGGEDGARLGAACPPSLLARPLPPRADPARGAGRAGAAGGVPIARARAHGTVPDRGGGRPLALAHRGGALLAMRERLPLLELLLSALCLWAGWYHTPAGALVRTAGAWIFGTRSTARPLLAYFGAGTLVPPRPPPPLAGPIPPAQALAYGTAAVLDGSALELAPRLVALSQRLGSDDAALLAIFCGEDAARFAVDEARSMALDDLARALPPRSEACIARAAQAAMLGGAYALGWPLPETVLITSPFGVREHPLIGGRRLHARIDLGASAGTAVHAVAAGVVRRASSDGINGRILG